MDLSQAIITEHAARQMSRRRVVSQGMIGVQLLRVFVDVDRQPPEVVTAYRTSKVGKYRRAP